MEEQDTEIAKKARTCDVYRTNPNLPHRFNDPDCFLGYGAKRGHPLYRTTNQTYGSIKPTIHEMPLEFRASSHWFSEGLLKAGMYRDDGFNITTDKSRIMVPLADYHKQAQVNFTSQLDGLSGHHSQTHHGGHHQSGHHGHANHGGHHHSGHHGHANHGGHHQSGHHGHANHGGHHQSGHHGHAHHGGHHHSGHHGHAHHGGHHHSGHQGHANHGGRHQSGHH